MEIAANQVRVAGDGSRMFTSAARTLARLVLEMCNEAREEQEPKQQPGGEDRDE